MFDEKLVWFYPVYDMSFPLVAFKIFSLSLNFSTSNMCPGWVYILFYFYLSCLELAESFEFVNLCLFLQICIIIFSGFFSCLFSLHPSFWDFNYTCVRHAIISPWTLRLCSFLKFFSLFLKLDNLYCSIFKFTGNFLLFFSLICC